MITLEQYHLYFKQVAIDLLGHSAKTPKHLRSSRVEFDNGSLEALSSLSKAQVNFNSPVLISIDYTGALMYNNAENKRDSKNASFALLIQKKDKEELSQYTQLEQIAKSQILKKMWQDWKKAMNAASNSYEFVRGFDLKQINYDQIRGGFDANLIGWTFNFLIHERLTF